MWDCDRNVFHRMEIWLFLSRASTLSMVPSNIYINYVLKSLFIGLTNRVLCSTSFFIMFINAACFFCDSSILFSTIVGLLSCAAFVRFDIWCICFCHIILAVTGDKYKCGNSSSMRGMMSSSSTTTMKSKEERRITSKCFKNTACQVFSPFKCSSTKLRCLIDGV